MSRTNILHLISTVSFLGAEQVIAEICCHTNTNKYNVFLGILSASDHVQLAFQAKLKSNKVTVTTFRCAGMLDISSLKTIKHFMSKHQIDILHTHGYKADIYALTIKKLYSTRFFLIASVHNWMIGTMREKIYKTLDKFVLKYFDHIITVSREIESELTYSRICDHRLHYIPNGINVDSCLSGLCRPAARLELGISDDTYAIGCVASLTYEKAHEHLIEAISILALEFPAINAVLVGEGSRRAFLEDIAKSLNVADKIVFLGYRHDVRQLYAAFDLFTLVSRTEGLPMALLEAMASGIPVVASSVGAIPELIGTNERGLLVKPCNVNEIVKAIKWHILNHEASKLLAVKGQELIKISYSSDHMCLAYENLYEYALCKS